MLLAYIDESGNTGDVSKGGSTPYYALGCVLVDADAWSASFDELIEFRRRLRDGFGLPMRAEVKANFLIRARGPFRPLGLAPAQRGLIYRAHLKMVESVAARAFSIVIDKDSLGVSGAHCFEAAWQTMLNRLERTCHYEKSRVMIIHDEGEDVAVRRQVRKARRFLTAGSMAGGSIRVDAKDIVDDPVPRSSAESYFVQLADLVAYAGWRTIVAPGNAVQPIVDSTTWASLGSSVHAAVNKYSGGTPGVVLRA